MTVSVPLDELHLAWPVLAPMLARVVKRYPSDDANRLLHVLKEGGAQLWAIVEGGKPVAAVVTRVKDNPRRCLIWMVAGCRVREWAGDFLSVIEPWARMQGCIMFYGIGRRGWDRVVPALGFELGEVNGSAAWLRRIA